VNVAPSASLNVTGPITVEAWIRTNSNSAQQGILERYGSWPFTNGGYSLRLNSTGRLQFFTLRNSWDWDVVTGSTVLTTGVWHHVAGIFDGAQLRVYVDGVLVGSKASTFAPVSGNTLVRIGARADDGEFSFNGLIDEARITAGVVYTENFVPQGQLNVLAGTRGLWNFDSPDTLDRSGNANHGVPVGTPSFSNDVPPGISIPSPPPSPAPTVNHSISLNGGSAYVNVPANATLNLAGPLTVEAWIKTNSLASQQGIIERYDWHSAAGGYGLRLTSTGKLAFFAIKSASEMDSLESQASVVAGRWHHVAGVHDGIQMRLYLDGVLVGTRAATTIPLSGSASLKIGARGDDATFKFNGLIDEARVSAAALYSSNFAPEMNLNVGSETRGLWKFNGEVVADASGHNNHGELVGGVNFSTDVPSGSNPGSTANGLPILHTEEDSDRAVAINAHTATKDPFSLMTEQNFGLDKRTRVMLFVSNFELLAGEGAANVLAAVESSELGSHLASVEYVGQVPDSNLTQIVVLLPGGLANAGDVYISVGLRGLWSNRARFSIGPLNPSLKGQPFTNIPLVHTLLESNPPQWPL
jgi:hypothetical protein